MRGGALRGWRGRAGGGLEHPWHMAHIHHMLSPRPARALMRLPPPGLARMLGMPRRACGAFPRWIRLGLPPLACSDPQVAGELGG